MEKMDDQERISALADGQLRGEDAAFAVQAAACDAQGRQTWLAYQAIGEVLRQGRPDGGTPPELFLSRLQEKLRQEAPLARPAPAPELVAVPVRPAANDWLWKTVAGLASVAAVAAVAWNVGGPAANVQPQLAAAPANVVPVADARTVTMIRDPRLDQLLAAHRQLGGANALQAPSGFLRNATFEGPAR